MCTSLWWFLVCVFRPGAAVGSELCEEHGAVWRARWGTERGVRLVSCRWHTRHIVYLDLCRRMQHWLRWPFVHLSAALKPPPHSVAPLLPVTPPQSIPVHTHVCCLFFPTPPPPPNTIKTALTLPSVCSPSCVQSSGPCTQAHPSTGLPLWWQCCRVSWRRGVFVLRHASLCVSGWKHHAHNQCASACVWVGRLTL